MKIYLQNLLMKLLLAIPALFSSVFLMQGGCGKHTVDCQDQQLSMVTVGYTVDEISEVSLLRYETGSNFSNRIDSTYYLLQRSEYLRNTDTIPLNGMNILNNSGQGPANGFSAFTGHDYEILVHKTGQRFRISDIEDEGHFTEETSNTTHDLCYNRIVSYKLNDKLTPNQDNTIIYLKK